jgi:hypothetical protein
MLNLVNSTTDKLQVITSSAATVDVHASWADLNAGTVTPGRTNTAIVSAATTDVVATPASSTTRNVKTLHITNKDASLSDDVTVQYNANATLYTMIKVTLRPGDTLEYIEGIGFFTVASSVFPLKNQSTASQSVSTVDLYLTGSSVSIPANLPVAGTAYRCVFDLAKTAGTGSPVVTIRIGTAGSTADTTCTCAFTFGVGTSVADTAKFEILAVFRTVGTGTSAVLQGDFSMIPNLAATGFGGTTPIRAGQTTSGGFNSTVANSIIGVSFNGSTAFAGTAQLVRAELIA